MFEISYKLAAQFQRMAQTVASTASDQLHHKVFIIDDQTVIFGSYNFSSNADTDNDENLLIVDNPEIARAFTGEYERILAQAQNPPERKRSGTSGQ